MQIVLRFGLKFLYLPGAFLLAMGLMMGFFTEQWWPMPLLITLAGAALVTAWGGGTNLPTGLVGIARSAHGHPNCCFDLLLNSHKFCHCA
jgi:hypothetical protein